MEFTSRLIQLRRNHSNLHRRKFFQDRVIRGSVVRDISWFNTEANEFSDDDWNTHWYRALAVLLNGRTLAITNEEGHPIIDESFLILVNAAAEGVEFTLPAPPADTPWSLVVNTEDLDDPFAEVEIGEKVIVGGRSIRVFSDGRK